MFSFDIQLKTYTEWAVIPLTSQLKHNFFDWGGAYSSSLPSREPKQYFLNIYIVERRPSLKCMLFLGWTPIRLKPLYPLIKIFEVFFWSTDCGGYNSPFYKLEGNWISIFGNSPTLQTLPDVLVTHACFVNTMSSTYYIDYIETMTNFIPDSTQCLKTVATIMIL